MYFSDECLFEPTSSPNTFIRNRNLSLDLYPLGHEDRIDAFLFEVCRSPLDTIGVTLESNSSPGYYIVDDNLQLKLRRIDNNEVGLEQATFRTRSMILGQHVGLAFESLAHRGYYLWIDNSQLFLREEPASNMSAANGMWNVVDKLTNFAGEERFVKRSLLETKLYLDWAALERDLPKKGFNNSNTFQNSCGPDAAMNALRWYGIDVLAGTVTHTHHESEPGVEDNEHELSITTTTPAINVLGLGREMKTNAWKVFGQTAPGTSTPNFVAVVRDKFGRFMPDDYEFHYDHGHGADGFYYVLSHLLHQGNPIMFNHRIGGRWASDAKGHFALVIGLEKPAGSSDINASRVFLSNGRDEDSNNVDYLAWPDFKDLWAREYYILSEPVLELFDEYPNTHIYLTDAPFTIEGAGSQSVRLPYHRK